MLTDRPLDVRVALQEHVADDPLLSQLVNIPLPSPVHDETPSAAGYVISLNNLG